MALLFVNINIAFARVSYLNTILPLPLRELSRSLQSNRYLKTIRCCASPVQQLQDEQVVSPGILCESCNGKGWLVCDFCNGQKTNVKAEKKRIYRRCPSCRAVGYILCSKCKVFKCVTFPSSDDGQELSF